MARQQEHLGHFDAARITTVKDELADRRLTGARRDWVAARSALGVALVETEDADGEARDELALTLRNGEAEPHVLPLERQALQQLSSKLDTPFRYVERLMNAGHLDMAGSLLGELLAREEPERRHLVRTLRGRVDGLLSDSFRSIDHEDVFTTSLETLTKLREEKPQVGDVELWDLRLEPRSFRMLLVAPGISDKVNTDRHFQGDSRWKAPEGGDVIYPAVTISNSETGHGSFAARPSLMRRVCQNYCVWGEGLARIHLGRKLEEGEQLWTSERTQALEDAAVMSKLADVLRKTFDVEAFRKIVEQLNATTERGLTADTAPLAVVDASIRTWGLTQERRDAILANFLGTADLTQYGLAQAITATTNPRQAGNLPDETRNLLEDVGGQVLRLSQRDWDRFLSSARNGSTVAVEVETPETVSVVRV